jgi:D-3-phosphoglycerate dehydrogenase
MKPTAFLINSARGGLINEADLVAALKDKKLAGAAIDVFEQEPPGDHPLFHLDNVIVTAHTAGVDTRSRDDMAAQSARGLVTLSKGGWPEGEVVNEQIRPKFKW